MIKTSKVHVQYDPTFFLGIFRQLWFLGLTGPFPGIDTWRALRESNSLPKKLNISGKTESGFGLDLQAIESHRQLKGSILGGKGSLKKTTLPPLVFCLLTNVGLDWADSNLNNLQEVHGVIGTLENDCGPYCLLGGHSLLHPPPLLHPTGVGLGVIG